MRLHATGRAGLFPVVALVALLLLSACGHGERTRGAAVECPSIAGVPDALLLLFGEMHGSKEAPALIHGLACSVSEKQAVAVGLEMPSQDQARLDAFMASDGKADDVDTLLATDFWQQGRDGRSSAAMFQLIEDLRARERLVGVAHEVFQQGVLCGREQNRFIAARGPARNRIEFKIAHAQNRQPARTAPQQRTHAR